MPGPDGWWRVLLFDATSSGPYWLPAAAGTVLGDTSSLPQPPGAPQAFTATLAASQVTFVWQVPAAGSAVTGYRVWRQEGEGAFARLGSDLAATALVAQVRGGLRAGIGGWATVCQKACLLPRPSPRPDPVPRQLDVGQPLHPNRQAVQTGVSAQ